MLCLCASLVENCAGWLPHHFRLRVATPNQCDLLNTKPAGAIEKNNCNTHTQYVLYSLCVCVLIPGMCRVMVCRCRGMAVLTLPCMGTHCVDTAGGGNNFYGGHRGGGGYGGVSRPPPARVHTFTCNYHECFIHMLLQRAHELYTHGLSSCRPNAAAALLAYDLWHFECFDSRIHTRGPGSGICCIRTRGPGSGTYCTWM